MSGVRTDLRETLANSASRFVISMGMAYLHTIVSKAFGPEGEVSM